MQIVTGTKHYDRQKFSTIRDIIRDCAERFADADAYRNHETPGSADTVRSYKYFNDDINTCGTALLDLGLQGKRIAVVGDNSYAWAVAH